MAGENNKLSSNRRQPPPSDRKSRRESPPPAQAPNGGVKPPPSAGKSSGNSKSSDMPTPKPGLNPSPAHQNPHLLPPPGPFSHLDHPQPPFGPPPAPTYGFHLLDRRTLTLADGTVRTYFALPPDYREFVPPPVPRSPMEPVGRFGLLSPDGFRGRDNPAKRRYEDTLLEERERDGFSRQRQQLLQYGNAAPGTSSPFRGQDGEHSRSSKHLRMEPDNVDPAVLKAFLHFSKLLNENANQKRNYVEDGKYGPLQCLACGRSSKDHPDVHSLVMHLYNSDNADLRVDHLGLHRAVCVLMGWNYLRAPDNSRAYQFLPGDEAAANQEDLIMWPPTVIIHNTNTGKSRDGRMEGLGNKTMDSILRDLGFPSGKSKSLYTREGHLGITLIKFATDRSGLKEAIRLADHFLKERHGRRNWAQVQSIVTEKDDENNPYLVNVDEKMGEKKRILYGYLGTASDLDKVDYDTRKKIVIESKRERLQSSK